MITLDLDSLPLGLEFKAAQSGANGQSLRVVRTGHDTVKVYNDSLPGSPELFYTNGEFHTLGTAFDKHMGNQFVQFDGSGAVTLTDTAGRATTATTQEAEHFTHAVRTGDVIEVPAPA